MIRKYTASADTTIVNAFQPNLTRRGTGSNMGMADVMEVFSIYGRETATSSQAQASQELSRMLIKFPATGISADRTANLIPGSGSVRFVLKLYNAQTSKTVPRDYKLVVHKVAKAWEEGVGLDLIGLMCIPPINIDPTDYFEEMSKLNKALGFTELSMGMSSDFLIAAKYLSTYLRVGSGIFGQRL